MTPPSAGATAGRLPRRPAPRAPRRVSGPARPRVQAPAARRRASRGARILAWLRALPDARFLDRLVRGRGWIALVGVGLIGIVFLQVSLLNLNAGISRAVTAAETLERQNASLREDISQLDAGDRLADGAAKLGLIMPSAGEVTFLDARGADGRRAAAGIRPPKPVATGGVAAAPVTAPATSEPTTGAATAATGTAPATSEPTAGATAAATGAAAPAATGTPATATTPADPTAAGTATAAGTPATTTATPATPSTTTGGAPAGTATTAATTTTSGTG